MTEHQIEKPGNVYRRNTRRSSYMKFCQIRSNGCVEMASDGRTEARTDGRTDESTTICSPFGKLN